MFVLKLSYFFILNNKSYPLKYNVYLIVSLCVNVINISIIIL